MIFAHLSGWFALRLGRRYLPVSESPALLDHPDEDHLRARRASSCDMQEVSRKLIRFTSLERRSCGLPVELKDTFSLKHVAGLDAGMAVPRDHLVRGKFGQLEQGFISAVTHIKFLHQCALALRRRHSSYSSCVRPV